MLQQVFTGERVLILEDPECAGLHSVSEWDINYLSAVYPFHLLNRNMVVSLNYQHLYDFNREWKYILRQNVGSNNTFWGDAQYPLKPISEDFLN